MEKTGETYQELFKWMGLGLVILIILLILWMFGINLPERYTNNWFNWIIIIILVIFAIFSIIKYVLMDKNSRKEHEEISSSKPRGIRILFSSKFTFIKSRISSLILSSVFILIIGFYILISTPFKLFGGIISGGAVITIIGSVIIWKYLVNE